MAYFLRYTENPKLDIDRGTSLHICDQNTPDAVFIKEVNNYAVIIDGLCGYDMDTESQEEAIASSIEAVQYHRKNPSGNNAETDTRKAYLFEGEFSSSDVPDGWAFHPKRLVCDISQLCK